MPSAQAARAIRLRRQAADNEHQARHDGLTGLPNRGSFYEQTGALRDMIVTHLLHLLHEAGGATLMEDLTGGSPTGPVAAGPGP